ncbi:hypothetical protein PMAYCL1PPCAC_05163 [Pristionchus mayeri]|uniref:Uncharacterized protein n=1 Tax=Pristionchus mayeri TaxID=1317129 RepID=A0AAN5C2V0_9BILA|nr:hypothetical protein PMAYCL1PPCAC_05163 [Pristionchus mayeri]
MQVGDGPQQFCRPLFRIFQRVSSFVYLLTQWQATIIRHVIDCRVIGPFAIYLIISTQLRDVLMSESAQKMKLSFFESKIQQHRKQHR